MRQQKVAQGSQGWGQGGGSGSGLNLGAKGRHVAQNLQKSSYLGKACENVGPS